MKTKNIRQSVTFKATPHELYEVIMDSRKHAGFTGSQVTIRREVGGKFSIYGGDIEGTNLELVPDHEVPPFLVPPIMRDLLLSPLVA